MYLWHLTHTLVFARRKIVSLFLLPALFLLAQAGPGLFKILLHRHYVVMQHATARKSDTILLLSAEEWAAVREVKPGEVSIQGRLFDVRNLSKKRNGAVELSGHFDHKQEKMLARAKAMDRQQHEVKVPIFLVFMFSEAPPEFSFYMPLQNRDPYRTNFRCMVLGGLCRMDGPPPRAV